MTVSMPASFAIFVSSLPSHRLSTAATSAGNAKISAASSRAFSGESAAEPPSTNVFDLESMCGSCSDESTCGKGKETPSSGSMSQQLSAPSMSVCGAPSSRRASSPMTAASSSMSFSSLKTSSLCSGATTRTMPIPQLNVAANSSQEIWHLAAIQRNMGGSSHCSAFSCACRSRGRMRGILRESPPLVMGAAAFSHPAFAKASSGFT
mmetsp:Transcript_56825/g.91977  ORF Transcript_56825/g.91977 Transcript_56825/m.91977 type:complete len:207 (-) Transcript_56825:2856-3476(-)